MNIRYPLLFLAGVLVGTIATYMFAGSSSVVTSQNTVSTEVSAAAESNTAGSVSTMPTGLIDVPKYPELDNAPIIPDTEISDAMLEEHENHETPVMTQTEKFERGIAGEEESPQAEPMPDTEEQESSEESSEHNQ